jgi:predicted dienelactone hydrolase
VRRLSALGALACALALLTAAPASAALRARPAFAVGKTTIVFTDHSRLVQIPGEGWRPRTLVTEIRYPAEGGGFAEVRNGTPARSDGPFPLIVFAHGFAAVPALYTSLLDAWARAGYIVAAPLFPLTNAGAPGGPNESDLANQPRDMSFLITRILARSRAARGILSGLVEPQEIAVTGQSDGGSTALALVGNSAFADHRVRAAMILSGAEILGAGTYDFPRPSPPILAVQGTADTSNAPASTYRWFALAPQPKFLLSLLGAAHLPPYTSEQPQLGIVKRETIAFLDRYLKHLAGAKGRMWKVGNVPGVARLVRTVPA